VVAAGLAASVGATVAAAAVACGLALAPFEQPATMAITATEVRIALDP